MDLRGLLLRGVEGRGGEKRVGEGKGREGRVINIKITNILHISVITCPVCLIKVYRPMFSRSGNMLNTFTLLSGWLVGHNRSIHHTVSC